MAENATIRTHRKLFNEWAASLMTGENKLTPDNTDKYIDAFDNANTREILTVLSLPCGETLTGHANLIDGSAKAIGPKRFHLIESMAFGYRQPVFKWRTMRAIALLETLRKHRDTAPLLIAEAYCEMALNLPDAAASHCGMAFELDPELMENDPYAIAVLDGRTPKWAKVA